jgi:urease gamma subunit
VVVTVQGEPDTAPFTRIYQFSNKTDYIILSNSIKSINNKLSRRLRINLKYVIDQLRRHKKRNEIIKSASKLLKPDQVMIGVPESLRKIKFNIKLEREQRLCMTLKEPIPVSDYVLAP